MVLVLLCTSITIITKLSSYEEIKVFLHCTWNVVAY